MPKSFVLSPPIRKRAHEKAPAGSRGRKGGEEVADNKKPCAPVEAESREYDVTFREIDPLCAALDELCMALNCWYAAMNSPWQREDQTYRKMLAKKTKTALKRIIQNEGESADEVSDKRCCKSIEDPDRS